jgi:hypothetical protein
MKKISIFFQMCMRYDGRRKLWRQSENNQGLVNFSNIANTIASCRVKRFHDEFDFTPKKSQKIYFSKWIFETVCSRWRNKMTRRFLLKSNFRWFDLVHWMIQDTYGKHLKLSTDRHPWDYSKGAEVVYWY